MDKEKLITAYKNTIQYCTALQQFRQNTDSMIKRMSEFHITVDEYATYSGTFVNNYGRMGDGLKVRVPEKIPYFRITTGYMLLEKKEKYNLSKASTRSGNNKPSLIVYVNGIKIPDSKVYLYCAESSTDIMIPDSYFDKGVSNDVYVERRNFDLYYYVGQYSEGFTGSVYEINISDHRKRKFDDNTILVFEDGLLVPHSDYSINKVNDIHYQVLFNDNREDPVDIEIFVDSSAVKVITKTVANSSIATFTVDETFRDPIYGPIPRDTSMFFCNGKRVANNDIEIAGRMNFEYNIGETLNTVHSVMIYTDLNLVNDTRLKFYGDDYYLYNMIGSEALTQALKTGSCGSVFDGKINYDDILNKNGLKYDKDLIQTLMDELETKYDYASKSKHLISSKPELLREFLNNYGEKRYYYQIVYDSASDPNPEDPVVLSTTKQLSDDKVVYYATHINGKYLTSIMTQSQDIGNVYTVSIPKDKLDDGTNVVELVEYICDKTNTFYTLTDVIEYDNVGVMYYQTTVPLFGNIKDKDDAIVLVPTDNTEVGSENLVYTDSRGLGFKKLKEIDDYTIDITGGNIIVDFGPNKPYDKVLISSGRYAGYHSLVFSEAITYESMIREINLGTVTINWKGEDTSFSVPLVHKGSILGYTVDERMFDGVDYMYRSQGTHDVMATSGIIVKRQFEIGDRLDFFFIPYEQRILKYREDTGDNRYGLIYISEGEFPYSPKYMNVFINGRKLTSADVDILSDKLIRVPRFRQSFQDLYIETCFSEDLSDLQDYFDQYSVSTFETELGVLFEGVDYKTSTIQGSIQIVNDTYESFVEGVDSVDRIPNPLRIENLIPSRYDPFINAYFLWKASDDVRATFNPIDDIPTEILSQFEIYYSGVEGNRRDVILNTSKQNLFSDILFDSKSYPALHPDIATRLVTEWMQEEGLTLVEAIDKYKEYNINNHYYEEDLRVISPTVDLDIEEVLYIGGIP